MKSSVLACSQRERGSPASFIITVSATFASWQVSSPAVGGELAHALPVVERDLQAGARELAQVQRGHRSAQRLVRFGVGVGGDLEVAAGELRLQHPLEAPFVDLANQGFQATGLLQGVERLAVERVLIGLRLQASQQLGSLGPAAVTRPGPCR